MIDEYAFIGDIHGTVGPMPDLISRAATEARQVIFLGDYINRGPDSRAVIDLLLDVSRELGDRVHFLCGHHDKSFLEAIETGRVEAFLRIGGAATLSNYQRRRPNGSVMPISERIPTTHVEFLRNLKLQFAGDGCLAMHYRGDSPGSMMGRFGIFGHHPQPDGRPLITDHHALIDTGWGTLPSGRLTCFLLPSKRWFQVF